MLCPKCGTENVDEAAFCKNCGTKLDGVNARSTEAEGEACKAKQKCSSDESNKSDLADQAKKNDMNVRFPSISAKPKLIVGAVILVAVLAIVVFVAGSNNGPSDEVVENLVRQAKIEENAPVSSIWEDKDGLTIQSVKVLQKDKTSGDVQSLARTGVVLSDPYTVKVEAVLSNDSTELTEQATFLIAKANDEWATLTLDSSSFSVVDVKLNKGVDCKLVEKNFGYCLDEIKTIGDNRMPQIYKDAKYKVKKETFDAKKKTDKLVIECTAKTATYDASATVTASFKYGNHGWDFESAEADENAQKLSHQKLVGTWTGKFDDQINPYGKCFAGKTNPMKINITSIDEDTGKIEGTVTALMHFHQPSSSDENSDAGDALIENIPFSITDGVDDERLRVGGSYDYKRDDKSSATIRFSIGDDDATSSVQCEYTGGTGFLNWWTYIDSYTISKAE